MRSMSGLLLISPPPSLSPPLQIANSPTGRLFFSSQHPVIKALRNAVFCETCTATGAAAQQAGLQGGDEATLARREKNYEAGSGEASTAINVRRNTNSHFNKCACIHIQVFLTP